MSDGARRVSDELVVVATRWCQRATSRTERELTVACWVAAAGLFGWSQFFVSDRTWQDNPYLLDICSGLTASLFGLPIVVVALTRITRRTSLGSAAAPPWRSPDAGVHALLHVAVLIAHGSPARRPLVPASTLATSPLASSCRV